MANSSSYIDLTNEHAGDAADGIVNIINAMAKAKQSQTDLQKEVMLDQISRSRNQQDAKAKLESEAAVKEEERQKNIQEWGKAFTDPSSPQGNPSTNSSGMANGATPDQVGTNPSSPVSPVGGAMPTNYGLPSPGETNLSSAFPITGGQSQPGAAPQAQAAPTQAPAPMPAPVQPPPMETAQPSSQYNDLGFKPIGLGQLGLARQGKPEPKDFAYIQALNKVKSGTATPGEIQLVKDFNGVKDNSEEIQKQKDKLDEQLQKRLEAMGKQIDPTQYRSGAFGDAKKVFDRGERLSSLIDAAVNFQNGGADSRQIGELAIGLNSMLAGNNVGAQEQVKSLIPRSVVGNATKLQEWLTNEPLGLHQQKFVERMMNTVNNEMATTKAQMDRTRFERLSSYYLLEKNHPDEFNAVLTGHGINPEDYQKWKANGSKSISAIQEKQAGPGGTKSEKTGSKDFSNLWN